MQLLIEDVFRRLRKRVKGAAKERYRRFSTIQSLCGSLNGNIVLKQRSRSCYSRFSFYTGKKIKSLNDIALNPTELFNKKRESFLEVS